MQDTDPFLATVSRAKNPGWSQQAATTLEANGGCVLHTADQELPTTQASIHKVALERLSDLQQRIVNRGEDPFGKDRPFRFLEVSYGDEERYDMPVSWKNDPPMGTPFSSSEASESTINFQTQVEAFVQPVLHKLWRGEERHVASSGILINQPGAPLQQWHRECSEEGLVTVLCLLVDLTIESGPTEIWLKSHKSMPGDDVSEKLLLLLTAKCQLLLLDRQMLCQYLENTSDSTSPWAYSVWQKGSPRGNGYTLPDALTLEYD